MGWIERKEDGCNPATVSGDRKRPTLDRLLLPLYFNGWAITRTLNAMKFGKRSIYTIIRAHANFQPIPRTFSGHL